MKSFVSILALVLFTSIAAAQPALERAHRHDPNTALALSIAGTAVPLALAVAGSVILYEGSGAGENNGLSPNPRAEALHDPAILMIGGGLVGAFIGPSLGHIYGENRFITTGFRVRLWALEGAGVGCGLGVLWALGGGDAMGVAFLAAEGLAAATFLTGAAIDIATARSATRRFDATHDERSLALAPIIIRTPSHASATGLGLVGRF